MVYFESFEEFQAASREVYARAPRKTRYCYKYSSHSEGHPEVVLKVTDDVSCLKFRTDHHHDLKYVDQFTQLVTLWMTVKDPIDSLDPSLLPSDFSCAIKSIKPDTEMVGSQQAGKSPTHQSARKKKRKA